MRAALYARYSTDQQSEASVEDQVRVCERLAERHGLEVVARYHDRAVSGGTADRAGYQDLLAAARARAFDVILCEDFSRLWRNPAEQGPRLAELQDLGVHIVTVSGLDSRQPGFKVIAGVMGSVNELARDEAAYRSRRGLEGLARQQKSTGGRAYGYIAARQSSSGCREIDEEQAEIVRWIFEQYAAGCSPRRIAGELNARGIPSPGADRNRVNRRKGKWMSSAIAGDPRKGVGILNNPLYTGRVIWSRVRWVRSAVNSKQRRQVINPASEWIEHRDERLRIVSDDLWERVKELQGMRSERIGDRIKRGISRENAKRTGRGPKHLFSTLLQCGQCGANFVVVDARSYGCSSYKHGGAAACSNDFRIRRDALENGLLDGIRRELLAPEVVDEFTRRVLKRLAEHKRQPAGDAKRIAELEAQVENLTEAIATGALRNSPALANRLASAEAELAKLREAMVARPMANVDRIIPRLAEDFRQLVAELPNAVRRDAERARITVRQYVGDKILVQREVRDGQALMAFRSQTGAMEAAFLRLPGADRTLQTNVVAGACFGATKTEVVCFSAGTLRQDAAPDPCTVPGACANGHPLTPDNLHIDQNKGRWRCRQCGRERAAAFRARQKRAA
jgi:site-specific DNA recombinase